MDNRLAWMLMEMPAAVVFALTFYFGKYHSSLTSLFFLSLWQLHYIHRVFIYPLGLSGRNKRMPILIAAFSFCFNVINAYLNGQYLFTLSGGYPDSWLGDPRLLIGTGVFAAGYIINRQADHVLRKLRAAGESIYQSAARRPIQVDFLSQLPGRDCRVDRMGHRNLVYARSGICYMDNG